jgi:hypothetical protein
MRVIETKVYTFDELSPSAQATALDECRYFGMEHDWWGGVYEDAAQVGVKITSFDLDRNRHATGTIPDCYETARLIRDNHGPDCGTYKTAGEFIKRHDEIIDAYPVSSERTPDQDGEIDSALDELEEEFRKSILEDYSIILQHECEYLSSDEAVEEMIRANEYEFTEKGATV